MVVLKPPLSIQNFAALKLLQLQNFLQQPLEAPIVFRQLKSSEQFRKAYKNWRWYFQKTLREVSEDLHLRSNIVLIYFDIPGFLQDIRLRASRFSLLWKLGKTFDWFMIHDINFNEP
jgi:hypothetical protein